MSKEEILDYRALVHGFRDFKECVEYELDPLETKSIVIEAIDEYASLKVSEALNSQWVSVKEGLPEQGSMVWFIHSGDFLAHGFFKASNQGNVSDEWFEACKHPDLKLRLPRVSHWQYVLIPKKPSTT